MGMLNWGWNELFLAFLNWLSGFVRERNRRSIIILCPSFFLLTLSDNESTGYIKFSGSQGHGKTWFVLLQGNRKKWNTLKRVSLFSYGVGIVTDILKINEKGVTWQAFEIKVIHNAVNSKPLFVVLLIRLFFFFQVCSWQCKEGIKTTEGATHYFSQGLFPQRKGLAISSVQPM